MIKAVLYLVRRWIIPCIFMAGITYLVCKECDLDFNMNIVMTGWLCAVVLSLGGDFCNSKADPTNPYKFIIWGLYGRLARFAVAVILIGSAFFVISESALVFGVSVVIGYLVFTVEEITRLYRISDKVEIKDEHK